MASDSGPSPFAGSPSLPVPSARPDGLLRRLFLAQILHGLGEHDPLSLARRDAARDFNRSGDTRVSTHLHGLVDGDSYLSIDTPSTANYAHTYTRGPLLLDDPELRAAWDQIADALYGPDGLLLPFQGSPAFAHGLLNESGVVVLAALVQATGPALIPQLVSYLAALVSRSTVRRAVDRLVQFELVDASETGYVVSADWE